MLKQLLTSLLLLFLISCEESTPNVTFERKAQGQNIDLSIEIDDTFFILRASDTIKYSIKFDDYELVNHLIKSDTDTVFTGSITKRSELYLLNRTLKNGNIAIHALEFTDSTVTGLETEYYQGTLIQEELKNIKTLSIETDTSTNKSVINVNKKNAKKIFRTVIKRLKPELLIKFFQQENITKTEESTDSVTTIEPKPFTSLIENTYPNPFNSYLNIKMRNSSTYNGQLFDLQGKLWNSFKFSSSLHQINSPQLPKGSYILKITNTKTNTTENIQVLKQ